MTRAITIGLILAALIGYGGAYGEEIAKKAPLCKVAPNVASKSLLVPQGAIWKREAVHVPKAPEHLSALLGWVNVATVLPCITPETPATVEIRKVRIIEIDPETDKESVIQEIEFDENRDGFQGQLFRRLGEEGEENWFGPGKGSDVGVNSGLKGNDFLVDISKTPNQIYHGWTNPRIASKPGYNYAVEVEARISGAARLQLGVDYWVDMQSDYNGWEQKCNGTNNCEAWVSRWYGDTKGEFQTFRAPDSFN